jgi:hypothetical protein
MLPRDRVGKLGAVIEDLINSFLFVFPFLFATVPAVGTASDLVFDVAAYAGVGHQR